jgi:hypothetical protein
VFVGVVICFGALLRLVQYLSDRLSAIITSSSHSERKNSGSDRIPAINGASRSASSDGPKTSTADRSSSTKPGGAPCA